MKKRAFTLAEVLITLTIIGVIAALTIPNLMQKWEDQHTISGLKTGYALINNAIKQVMQEEGVSDLRDLNWPLPQNMGANDWRNGQYLAQHMKLKFADNECTGGLKIPKNGQCADSRNYNISNLTKDVTNIHFAAVTNCGYFRTLTNGMGIAITLLYPEGRTGENTLGTILLDINGFFKGPNRYGFDVFVFDVYPQSGIANPNTGLNHSQQTFSTNCDITKKNSSTNGISCAIWILTHHNVDYKYKDVKKPGSWWQWL